MSIKPLSRAVGLALLVGSLPAFAVTNVENNANIPFNFSNPGARSLGMGGAFLGLADDATAAYTNPAGLTGLGLEQQISVEVRRNDFSTRYATGGSTDNGGISYGSADSDVSNLAFIGYVLPRENWALAFYRHTLLDFSNDFTAGEISFFNDSFATFSTIGSSDLEIINYGASFAWDLSDALTLGVGLSWYDFDIDTRLERYGLGETTGDPAGLVNVQRQDGSDSDFGYNLGLLYRGGDNFQIGVNYRSAPSFTYEATNDVGGVPFAARDARFKAPDMFGVGFAWRVSDTFTLNLDVNYLAYSNLSDPIESAFFDNASAPDGELAALRRLEIDNVIEPRLGAEWVLADMRFPISLRAGAWYEESRAITYQGEPPVLTGDFSVDAPAGANAAIFSTGEDEMHYAFGFGMAFDRFQLDFATDQSDRADIYSISAVVRF